MYIYIYLVCVCTSPISATWRPPRWKTTFVDPSNEPRGKSTGNVLDWDINGELNDFSAISAISTCYHWSFRYILIHCLSNSKLQFHIEHHLNDLNVSVSIWTDLSCVVLRVYLLPHMRMNLCALCITRQKCYVCRAPESNHAMRPPF